MGISDILKEKAKDLVQQAEQQVEEQVRQVIDQGNGALEEKIEGLKGEAVDAAQQEENDLTRKLTEKASELLKSKE
jgi:hypothetical protein